MYKKVKAEEDEFNRVCSDPSPEGEKGINDDFKK